MIRIRIVEVEEQFGFKASPVQFVEVEDGQENTKQVDENPDRVQHIVTVRSLRLSFRSYF